jgi:hypothetical protein
MTQAHPSRLVAAGALRFLALLGTACGTGLIDSPSADPTSDSDSELRSCPPGTTKVRGRCEPIATCGDAACNGSESCSTCAQDCGACPTTCGNGTCDTAEDCTECAQDCGSCGSPDVVVTGFSWTPSAPLAGQVVTFTASIQNIGGASTPNGVIVGVGFSAAGLGTIAFSDTYTGPLGPGAAVTVTGNRTWTSVAGSYAVVAHVDDVNRFAELDESNNTLTKSLTVSGTTTPPSTTGELARQADSFVDSIGVNVHLFYTGGVYVDHWADIVQPRLRESGIRHLRDHALKTTDWQAPLLAQKLQTLAAAGTRALLILDDRYCTPAEGLAFVKSAGAGSVVDAVEGWNEPDIRLSSSGTTWTWVAGIKSYMSDTWTRFRGDAATAGLPVGSPSNWRMDTPSHFGDVSGMIDFGAIHPYPNWPNSPVNSDILTQHMNAYRANYGNKPFWVGETGYHTGGAGSDRPISETKHGKYMPRLLLEYFNRGAARSYVYELVDQGLPGTDREKSFGLVRNDGSPKPAFTAIKNLLGVLADPGASFTPGRLDYALFGSTTNVHHTLLQKRDGRFYLVLWLEVSSTDSTVSQPVTLTLAKTASTLRVFAPNEAASATQQYSAVSSVTLSVPDKPVVVEVTP